MSAVTSQMDVLAVHGWVGESACPGNQAQATGVQPPTEPTAMRKPPSARSRRPMQEFAKRCNNKNMAVRKKVLHDLSDILSGISVGNTVAPPPVQMNGQPKTES